MKLGHQFGSKGTGGKRVADHVGAGSDDWDENAKAQIQKDVRARALVSVLDMLVSRRSGMLSYKVRACKSNIQYRDRSYTQSCSRRREGI